MAKLLAGVVVAWMVAGCIVESQPQATVAAGAATPDMVAVDDGVQVIADYDEAIFYADSYYWWNVNGAWYRSSYYTGGWAYVAAPPVVIAGIHTPHAYVHYRPHGYVVRRRPVPIHHVHRPVHHHHHAAPRPHQRDHRSAPPAHHRR